MKKIILFITLSIILFNLVSAVPPFQFGSEVITKGLVIESPVYSTLKNSEDFHYNFHVFNATSGKLMDNTTTTCYFHLYDSTGDVIFSIYNVGMNGNEHTFSVTILGTNFTENTKGGFLTHCNTSDVGGFVSGGFYVTPTGFQLDEARAIFYMGMFGILIFIFIINLIIIPLLPSENNKDEEGVLMSINHLKYLRPILYVTAYLFLMSIIFVGSNLSLAYLGTTLLGNLLFKIFYIMMAFALPMVFIWFIYIFYSIFQDKKMKQYIERGIINEKIPEGKW